MFKFKGFDVNFDTAMQVNNVGQVMGYRIFQHDPYTVEYNFLLPWILAIVGGLGVGLIYGVFGILLKLIFAPAAWIFFSIIAFFLFSNEWDRLKNKRICLIEITLAAVVLATMFILISSIYTTTTQSIVEIKELHYHFKFPF